MVFSSSQFCCKAFLRSRESVPSRLSFRGMENQQGPGTEEGSVLERSHEFRERSGTETSQEGHEAPTLQRTPEIRETQSGNVEIRKDPDHVQKSTVPKVLGSKDTKVATNPEDILAFRRAVEDIDAPLE